MPAASKIAEGSQDPVIRMIHSGLNHVHTSLQGALELGAGIELERAGRFLTVMDTLVTLAPLLGLLGTVTGLMRAFLSVGSAELSVVSRHWRHRRGVDRDGLRPGHRDFFTHSIQLFQQPASRGCNLSWRRRRPTSK